MKRRGVYFLSLQFSKGRDVPYSVSQNFLTSARVIERLLDLTDIAREDHVLEIGAGKGHITRRLADRCGCLTAYEVDSALHARLCRALPPSEGLRLHHADFLRAKLPQSGGYKVFSNIPFSITSAIVRKLACAPNPPSDSWLVVEKGAAKRFMGKPAETLSSLTLKPFFDMRILYHFRREDFHPMPRVDAVLLHLRLRERAEIPLAARGQWEAFIRAMWPGAAGGHRAPLSAGQARAALQREGLFFIPQSGTLSYVQWLCLFRSWARFSGGKTRRK